MKKNTSKKKLSTPIKETKKKGKRKPRKKSLEPLYLYELPKR
jgi:hypothetical protein